MEDLCPGFKERGTEVRRRIPPASAVSPVILIQSNKNARVTHLGAACPWSLHVHRT